MFDGVVDGSIARKERYEGDLEGKKSDKQE